MFSFRFIAFEKFSVKKEYSVKRNQKCDKSSPMTKLNLYQFKMKKKKRRDNNNEEYSFEVKIIFKKNTG